MATTDLGTLGTPSNNTVFTEPFDSLVSQEDCPEEFRKLVRVTAAVGLCDIFGRPYPRKVCLWVHHFDDYGVLVEGTYEVLLARKALTKVGYPDAHVWGYRPILVGQVPGEWPAGVVGGRGAVAFYFDSVL